MKTRDYAVMATAFLVMYVVGTLLTQWVLDAMGWLQ